MMRRRRLGAPRRHKEERESTIPLINVVFLLLVFFLVAGTLSAPRDATVDLATAEAFDPAALDPQAIYVDASGAIRVAGTVMDAPAALAKIEGDGLAQGQAIVVVPDRTLEASLLLARLAELRQASARPIRILTRRPGGGA
ncbi:biopolymer transporter ExbD [Acuticoccus sp. I52.16.1]|uniref:biopolymer transporter ExbD n=1 Tax=Acuticoccus sp. I52.16.1 TaxID=2928472 RepID=UPI001FD389EA|nr:biopolymer transporter ExbD [Acuticoccus sp. I52.16.1]UOM37302.1 biopolymer transporter ExbD [Acuticoccus sp. I52.16.1]